MGTPSPPLCVLPSRSRTLPISPSSSRVSVSSPSPILSSSAPLRSPVSTSLPAAVSSTLRSASRISRRSTPSAQVCLSKSPNKHNRIHCTACPLTDDLSQEIEDDKIGSKQEPKERARRLQDNFEWDPNDAKKIWCFGPDT